MSKDMWVSHSDALDMAKILKNPSTSGHAPWQYTNFAPYLKKIGGETETNKKSKIMVSSSSSP